jgi:hypothetical protein
MLFSKQEIINTYFNDNFTDCPVEYEGLRFETPDTKEWISLFLLPESANKEAENGLFKIICYSSSATLVFKLADKVKAFLDNAQFDGLSFGIGYGDGLGCSNLENGIYQTVVLFDVEAINVNCIKG